MTAVANMASSDVTLNLAMLTLMQKNLQGTIFGGGNPHFDIPQLLSMYKAGRLNLDDMVTRQYKLEQINDGYKDMLEGRNIRGVIRYTDADRAEGRSTCRRKPSRRRPCSPHRRPRGGACSRATGTAGWR